MTKLIEMSLHDGTAVYINPDRVAFVNAAVGTDERSVVVFSQGTFAEVIGEPAAVAAMLNRSS